VTALLHSMTGADSQEMEVWTTRNAHRRARESRWGRSGDTDPRRSEEQALHVAAGNADVEEVRRLITAGEASPAANGGACDGLRRRCVAHAGAEVNDHSQAHHYFAAPLHFAVRGASAITMPHIARTSDRPRAEAYAEVIAVLLEAKAQVDAADERGHTALHRAASYGDPAIVSQLLAAGADPNQQDRSGWTALRHAQTAGQDDAVAVLQGSKAVDAVEAANAAAKAADVKRLLRAGAAAGVASAWNNNIEALGRQAEVDRWRDAAAQLERIKLDKALAAGTQICVHPHGQGTYVKRKWRIGAKKHRIDFGGEVGVRDMKLKKVKKWTVAQGVVEGAGGRWKDADAQLEFVRADKAPATGTQIHLEPHGQGKYVSRKRWPIGLNRHMVDFGEQKSAKKGRTTTVDVGVQKVKFGTGCGCCCCKKKTKWRVVKRWGVGVITDEPEDGGS